MHPKTINQRKLCKTSGAVSTTTTTIMALAREKLDDKAQKAIARCVNRRATSPTTAKKKYTNGWLEFYMQGPLPRWYVVDSKGARLLTAARQFEFWPWSFTLVFRSRGLGSVATWFFKLYLLGVYVTEGCLFFFFCF
jgi:hypothetical protein